ncbi:MAG: hypothetical protein SPL30_08495 [Succinivibrio sp.]|jgi:hypothetical protein|nr:hypothetical protein [Succinivibrio sp.]
MNTFILMWNPAVSSYRSRRFAEDMSCFELADFNWSVFEHDKARDGDRFFMVKVGADPAGVVMSGYLTSDPYEAEDWSGKVRRIFYSDFSPDHMFNPDKAPLFTTAQLAAAVPDFDWSGGHSGRMLTPSQAQKLEQAWDEHLAKLGEGIYEDSTAAVRVEEITVDGAAGEALFIHKDQKDINGDPFILHVFAVALCGTSKEEIITGFLHEALERHRYCNAASLALRGVNGRELEALKLLTRGKGLPYADYIKRLALSGNALAIAVKISCLEDEFKRTQKGRHTGRMRRSTLALEQLRAAQQALQVQ